MDCDRNREDCGISAEELRAVLEKSLENETEQLRTYTILSERIHHNDGLKEGLHNFAEGNAKRSRQLQDELRAIE